MSAAAFGKLAALRERPLPAQAPLLALKKGFRDHPIDAGGEAQVEPLVDACALGLRGENFYASRYNPPYYEPIAGATEQLLVRLGVAQRLIAADARLGEAGLALWLFDGWRPDAVQVHFHDHWMPEMVRSLRPDLDDAAVAAEVETYWSAPTRDPGAPAPHMTGGAVDLTLCWRATGVPLWMGSLFDDVGPLAHLDRFEPEPRQVALSHLEARANRRLLYWVMTEAGFAANPSEWWHYSRGDQMWARLTGAQAARYGVPADAP